MDKIAKALLRLNAKERESVKKILLSISAGKFEGLHIKKLRGRKDIFRARKGKVRIIYRVKSGSVFILVIERRSEKTYR